MITYKKSYISELCLEYSFGDIIDKEINQAVLKVYSYLKDSHLLEQLKILDIAPTYNTITIHFDIKSELFSSSDLLDKTIEDLQESEVSSNPRTHIINVIYNGPDLDFVCSELSISKKELVSLHANKTYPIAMIGFRPYFPYLLGLDAKLTLPRRDDPRLHVKKGSVAIAAGQTGIYSEDSPGGWHIIGYTDFDQFERLRAGDTIIFNEVEDAN